MPPAVRELFYGWILPPDDRIYLTKDQCSHRQSLWLHWFWPRRPRQYIVRGGVSRQSTLSSPAGRMGICISVTNWDVSLVRPKSIMVTSLEKPAT